MVAELKRTYAGKKQETISVDDHGKFLAGGEFSIDVDTHEHHTDARVSGKGLTIRGDGIRLEGTIYPKNVEFVIFAGKPLSAKGKKGNRMVLSHIPQKRS